MQLSKQQLMDIITPMVDDYVACQKADRMLGDLLAIIHRDGGHHRHDNGTVASTFDAIAVVHGLRAQVEAHEGEMAKLRFQLGITQKALKHFASVWDYGDCMWVEDHEGLMTFDWESVRGAGKLHAEALQLAGSPLIPHPLHEDGGK